MSIPPPDIIGLSRLFRAFNLDAALKAILKQFSRSCILKHFVLFAKNEREIEGRKMSVADFSWVMPP